MVGHDIKLVFCLNNLYIITTVCNYEEKGVNMN